MIKKIILIKGLCVAIQLPSKNGKTGQIIKRKIVSPEFIELWFHIIDNQWSNELWLKLSSSDKEYLSICVRQAQIFNPDFERALAKTSAHLHERLKLVEESIKAGNLNPSLQQEFNSILDRLSASGQLSTVATTKLKKRMQRSLDKQT
jgi:hypothetical protein